MASGGLGPFELPDSLFYLTPPPPWFMRNALAPPAAGPPSRRLPGTIGGEPVP
jgi:hypothetical protein